MPQYSPSNTTMKKVIKNKNKTKYKSKSWGVVQMVEQFLANVCETLGPIPSRGKNKFL
jgi:hypothetical protein